MTKRISIGTWAFATEAFDSICERMKALRYDGVELAARPPHPLIAQVRDRRADHAHC